MSSCGSNWSRRIFPCRCFTTCSMVWVGWLRPSVWMTTISECICPQGSRFALENFWVLTLRSMRRHITICRSITRFVRRSWSSMANCYPMACLGQVRWSGLSLSATSALMCARWSRIGIRSSPSLATSCCCRSATLACRAGSRPPVPTSIGRSSSSRTRLAAGSLSPGSTTTPDMKGRSKGPERFRSLWPFFIFIFLNF